MVFSFHSCFFFQLLASIFFKLNAFGWLVNLNLRNFVNLKPVAYCSLSWHWRVLFGRMWDANSVSHNCISYTQFYNITQLKVFLCRLTRMVFDGIKVKMSSFLSEQWVLHGVIRVVISWFRWLIVKHCRLFSFWWNMFNNVVLLNNRLKSSWEILGFQWWLKCLWCTEASEENKNRVRENWVVLIQRTCHNSKE